MMACCPAAANVRNSKWSESDPRVASTRFRFMSRSSSSSDWDQCGPHGCLRQRRRSTWSWSFRLLLWKRPAATHPSYAHRREITAAWWNSTWAGEPGAAIEARRVWQICLWARSWGRPWSHLSAQDLAPYSCIALLIASFTVEVSYSQLCYMDARITRGSMWRRHGIIDSFVAELLFLIVGFRETFFS